jgi:hypothetical protein
MNVDDFVAAKASNFNKSQMPSTNGPQQVQHQSLKSNKFQQVSIRVGIWFGTRCSTQRPFDPKHLERLIEEGRVSQIVIYSPDEGQLNDFIAAVPSAKRI